MTCGCTDGFVGVHDPRTGELRGETACPRCRPGDAALVAACESLRDRENRMRYDHGKWTEVA